MSAPVKITGIRIKTPPVVEISDEGIYVWFKRGVYAEKTVVKQRWPLVAVDYDKDGDLIGVEVVPFPKSFSLNGVLAPAGLKVSDRMAAKAEIQPVKRMDAAQIVTA
jgi:hypothetical protein